MHEAITEVYIVVKECNDTIVQMALLPLFPVVLLPRKDPTATGVQTLVHCTLSSDILTLDIGTQRTSSCLHYFPSHHQRPVRYLVSSAFLATNLSCQSLYVDHDIRPYSRASLSLGCS